VHAITLETKYGVPTVALHTDKFHRVVASVTRVAGLPEARRAFVAREVTFTDGSAGERTGAFLVRMAEAA